MKTRPKPALVSCETVLVLFAEQITHPHDTANVWATQVGYDALTIVVKEFWPDIRRKLRKK